MYTTAIPRRATARRAYRQGRRASAMAALSRPARRWLGRAAGCIAQTCGPSTVRPWEGLGLGENSAALAVKELAVDWGQLVAGFFGIGEHGVHPRCLSRDTSDPVNGVASREKRQRAGLAIHGQDSVTGAGQQPPDSVQALIAGIADPRH